MTAQRRVFIVLACVGTACAQKPAQPEKVQVALHAMQVHLGTIDSGSREASLPILVDACRAVSVDVAGLPDGSSTALLGPAGEVIAAETTAPRTAAPCAGAGRYTLVVRRPTTDDADVPFVATVQLDSGLRAGLTLKGDPQVGRRLTVSALVLEEQTPFVGADIELTLTDPTDVSSTVSLRDNGESFDAKRGDGLYTGVFSVSTPGEHSLGGIVRGTSRAGFEFERHVAAGVVVREGI